MRDEPGVADSLDQLGRGETGAEGDLDCQFRVAVADVLIVRDALLASDALPRPAAPVNLAPGATGTRVWRIAVAGPWMLLSKGIHAGKGP